MTTARALASRFPARGPAEGQRLRDARSRCHPTPGRPDPGRGQVSLDRPRDAGVDDRGQIVLAAGRPGRGDARGRHRRGDRVEEREVRGRRLGQRHDRRAKRTGFRRQGLAALRYGQASASGLGAERVRRHGTDRLFRPDRYRQAQGGRSAGGFGRGRRGRLRRGADRQGAGHARDRHRRRPGQVRLRQGRHSAPTRPSTTRTRT